MQIVIDSDVKAVAEFMQERLPAVRLVSVANAIAAIAPLLWDEDQAERIRPLRLVHTPISAGDPHTPLAANE